MKRMVLTGLCFLVLAGCTGGPQARYPIEQLAGDYSVAAYYFWNVEENGRVSTYAVALANNMADYLREHDITAYVADLGTEAAVLAGSYATWEDAQAGAKAMGQQLQKIVAGPQAPGGTPRGGTSMRTLGVEPFAVDVKVLKERSRRLRHLHP
jgi:hypothetical protein